MLEKLASSGYAHQLMLSVVLYLLIGLVVVRSALFLMRRLATTPRVLIVDDVITAGTAIRESIGIIRAAGGEALGVPVRHGVGSHDAHAGRLVHLSRGGPGPHRQPAFALCRYQVCKRTVCTGVCHHLRYAIDWAALLQCIRTQTKSQRPLCSGDSAFCKSCIG